MSTPKVVWAAKPECLDQVDLKVYSVFAESFTIARFLLCFLEFTLLGVDKAFVLEELCYKLNFPLKETFACGGGVKQLQILSLLPILKMGIFAHPAKLAV
ncbi:MAG: hypothetical protein K2X04_12200 [Burkholderiales bacterium]|nr:hypothetical protein [Burkholderiales bacterium]